MGWYSVDEITIKRDYETREIIVSWRDAVTGDEEERFPFDGFSELNGAQEAFMLAKTEFTQLNQ